MAGTKAALPGRRSSLALRLIGIYTLIAAAVLMIVASLVVFVTRQQVTRDLDGSIRRTVQLFASGPARQIAAANDLEPAARSWLASTPLSQELSVLVRLPSNRTLASAGAPDVGATAAGRTLLSSDVSRSDRFSVGDETLRAASVPIRLDGQTIGTLVVAASERRVEASVQALLEGMLWSSVAGLVMAALLGYLAVRRTLRPLEQFTQEVQEIESGGDLSRRVGDGSSDEVGRLGAAFDDLLERLQHSFESQKRFVADASHELRTPLTIARGQLELLAGEIETEAGRRSAGIALEELDRMGRIVEDLLLLARLDEGLALELRPVEVELVVQEALLRGMRIELREAEVTVEPGLFVLADPERLLQVLSNLVTNAIRHAPGAALRVTARRDAHGVVIDVSDTGPGIPPDEIGHVFDRLYRGSRSGGASGGAGLGLAIAKSLTEAMGGTIWVTSTPGVGTTFSLRLPAVTGDDQPASRRSSVFSSHKRRTG